MRSVYLVRHAQASFGALDYDALSPLGVEQARAVGAAIRIRGRHVRAIVSGTMTRQKETAAQFQDATPVVYDARWNEYDHQDILRGLDSKLASPDGVRAFVLASENPERAFQKLFAAALARWTSGEYDADYRESFTAFAQRIAEALNATLTASPAQDHAADPSADSALVIVTSAGPIAVVLMNVLGLSISASMQLQNRIANASLSELLHRHPTPNLEVLSVGEVGHLYSEGRNLFTYR